MQLQKLELFPDNIPRASPEISSCFRKSFKKRSSKTTRLTPLVRSPSPKDYPTLSIESHQLRRTNAVPPLQNTDIRDENTPISLDAKTDDVTSHVSAQSIKSNNLEKEHNRPKCPDVDNTSSPLSKGSLITPKSSRNEYSDRPISSSHSGMSCRTVNSPRNSEKIEEIKCGYETSSSTESKFSKSQSVRSDREKCSKIPSPKVNLQSILQLRSESKSVRSRLQSPSSCSNSLSPEPTESLAESTGFSDLNSALSSAVGSLRCSAQPPKPHVFRNKPLTKTKKKKRSAKESLSVTVLTATGDTMSLLKRQEELEMDLSRFKEMRKHSEEIQSKMKG
eukprot:407517_1